MRDLRKYNKNRLTDITKKLMINGTLPKSTAGAFAIKLKSGAIAYVLACAKKGYIQGEIWDHVKVKVADIPKGVEWWKSEELLPYIKNTKRCARWEEMCEIKEGFWEDEDTVFQIHPPKSQYVNLEEFALHLWRPIISKNRIPPVEYVII